MPPVATIPCVLMRGGTSKAVVLWAHDLPVDPASRDALIQNIFGSPDARQIDGLGGADPLTSKVAIIGRDAPDGCHCTYTFGQVGIDHAGVDYESLCGNITSAVGHFAVTEGLCPADGPLARVRVYNTNLRRVLEVDVPVEGGRVIDDGDFEVPGVPGSGARIRVNLAGTAGGRTGAVLPTGAARETLECPGFGDLTVTLMDVGNPHVFLRAADVGLNGTEPPSAFAANPALLDALEGVRGAAAARLGLVERADRSRTESPAVPILGIVSPPQDYLAPGAGATVSAEDMDLTSRLLFMQRPHKAYAGTSTVCTGVAARVDGTVVAEVARKTSSREVRIGHPAGVIVTEIAIGRDAGAVIVDRATVDRTARRILDGSVYLR